jgi:hypothetical protein
VAAFQILDFQIRDALLLTRKSMQIFQNLQALRIWAQAFQIRDTQHAPVFEIFINKTQQYVFF